MCEHAATASHIVFLSFWFILLLIFFRIHVTPLSLLQYFQWVQEKEKDSWEMASNSLKQKLEIAESNFIRTEVEVAKMRSISIISVILQFLLFSLKT